jgi:hypothetical protein
VHLRKTCCTVTGTHASIACSKKCRACFDSFAHAESLIGEREWDMQWKVVKNPCGMLRLSSDLGPRGEPCFDNILEQQGYDPQVTKALSNPPIRPPCCGVAWARDRGYAFVSICLCILLCFLLSGHRGGVGASVVVMLPRSYLQ